MSDCSTSAMKPKELRMCKACGHENVCAYQTPFETLNCNNWIESSERYEQLAQVARDLEELAHFAILHIENDLVRGPAVDRLVILRDKLRECGVSVDYAE